MTAASELRKALGAMANSNAFCPNHSNRNNPSLSISEGPEGQVLFHCHRGCSQESVISTLESLGLWKTEARKEKRDFALIAWNEATEIRVSPDDLASVYMNSRGLSSRGLPPSLRFSRRLWHSKNGNGEAVHLPALVAKITDINGSFLGIQRIYLDQQGRKSRVTDSKKMLGAVKGGAVHLGSASETLAVAEGVETSLAVREATRLPTWSAVSASGLRNLELPTGLKTLHIFADKDRSSAGETAAKSLAVRATQMGVKAHIHLPPGEIGPEAKSVDWLDVYAASGPKLLLESLNSCPPFQVTSDVYEEVPTWGELKPLPDLMPTAPNLPDALIPSFLKEWILDSSERMRCAPEMIAVPLLAAFGSLLGRSIAVQPRQNDTTWTEHPNLWGAIVCPPGRMKSPAIAAALTPFRNIKAAITKEMKEKSKANELKLFQLQEKLAAQSSLYKKAVRSEEEGADSEGKVNSESFLKHMAETKAAIAALIPAKERLETNDATIEKIGELLIQDPVGILYYRDELSGQLALMERPDRGADRAFFLEGWNGKGSFETDRIGRGSLYVPAVCLSLLGGIQPEVLAKFFKDSLTKQSASDGFLARFQLLIYPDRIPFENVDRAPNREALEKVESVFRGAHKHLRSPVFSGAAQAPLFTLKLESREAQSLFNEYLKTLGCAPLLGQFSVRI